MLERAIRWWSLPIGRVSWSWVAAFAAIEAAALWATYAATGSFYVQCAVILGATVPWHALRHRASLERPFPPRSGLRPMTVSRLMELIGVSALSGAIGIALSVFGDDALGIGAGPLFWIYVASLFPQMVLWNTSAAFRRYGGAFPASAPSGR